MEQGSELAEAPEGDNGGKKNNVAGNMRFPRSRLTTAGDRINKAVSHLAEWDNFERQLC
jgi:hypothetical protein